MDESHSLNLCLFHMASTDFYLKQELCLTICRLLLEVRTRTANSYTIYPNIKFNSCVLLFCQTLEYNVNPLLATMWLPNKGLVSINTYMLLWYNRDNLGVLVVESRVVPEYMIVHTVHCCFRVPSNI